MAMVTLLGVELTSPGFLLGLGLGFAIATALYFVVLPALARLLWPDDRAG